MTDCLVDLEAAISANPSEPSVTLPRSLANRLLDELTFLRSVSGAVSDGSSVVMVQAQSGSTPISLAQIIRDHKLRSKSTADFPGEV